MITLHWYLFTSTSRGPEATTQSKFKGSRGSGFELEPKRLVIGGIGDLDLNPNTVP